MDIEACKKIAEKIESRAKRARGRRSPDPFMEGFAIALADLVRGHDQPSMAADVIAGHGFTLDDFAGCDPYDLKVIRKLFRTESVLR
jgi:hypothetical protein